MVAQYVQHERNIRVGIRGGPPGTGKTWELFKNWNKKSDERKLYLSHSHSFLSEQTLRVKGKVRHLFGLKLICPCLQNGEHKNSLIINLVDLKFQNRYICTICKEIKAYPQKECRYKQQFKNLKKFPIIVAPIEYAMYTSTLDDYQPQYIAVDDCLTRIKIHPSSYELVYALANFSELTHHPMNNVFDVVKSQDVLRRLISRPDYEKLMEEFNEVYIRNVKLLAEEVKNKTKPSCFDPIFLIPPAEIDSYCKRGLIYGFRDRFATPALFPLFDHVFKNKTEDDEVQLKIIEAIPKMNFLNSIATRYQVEKNVTVNFELDEFEPKIVDRCSMVYRYIGKKNAWYPATTSIKESFYTRDNIRKVIAKFLEKEYNNYNLKIGLITPKNIAWQFFIPKGYDNVE